MEPGSPSRTALSAAVARGTHRLWDDPPWIIDDPFALSLVGPEWEEEARLARSWARPEITRQGHTGVLVRARYPEDRLLQGDFDQYVMLGAGLDSFVWRHPEPSQALVVFEVDHPETQDWKRARAATLSLPFRENHRFIPVDLETDDLRSALGTAGFDWSTRTFLSCVGTTMYLPERVLISMLKVAAECPIGSEIVLSYNQHRDYLDDIGRETLDTIEGILQGMGEPLRSGFAPTEIEALIQDAGLGVAEHPTAEDLRGRYCDGRTDGLRPYSLERFVVGRHSL